MRRLLLALALALPLRAAAVEIPAAGLPAGMGSAAPLLAVKPASVGTFHVMRAYALTLGDGLPNRAAWEGLPKDASLAATPLLGKLPASFWTAALDLQRQSPEKQARMREQFLAAHAAAAVDAGKIADAAVAALEKGIEAGTVAHGDLSVLESQLRWLSVYGGRAEERYREVRRAAADSRQRKVDAALAKAKLAPAPQDAGAPVPGSEPPRRPLLSKAAVNRVGRAAGWTGAGMLAVSAAATFHPGLLHGPEHLPGLLTWGGAAALGVGRWLGPAKARAAAAAAAGKTAALKIPEWLKARLKTFVALSAAARESARAEAALESKVGDGRLSAFWTWLRAGARTGLYWFPLSLLGMLGGNIAAAIAAAPLKLFGVHAAAAAAAAPDTSAVAAIPFWDLINGYAAQMVLAELLLLGVVFRGVRWAAAKVVSDGKAAWIAGAVSLAAAFAGLWLTGYPLSLAPAVLGAEAVMIALYAGTRTLLAPGLARLGFALMAVESTRMMAFLQAKSLPGALAGLPDWAGLAVAGLLGMFFLLKPLKAQLARVKDLGLWWAKPSADGAPKKAAPMLSAGLLWAVPVYLAMEAAFRAVHFVLPQAEPTPEILGRMLLMPIDVILFNFVIVAALEEWVFRRGVFKPLVERVKKWGAPSKWWFWPAAVVSALIFSGAHYIDWGAMLAHLGIGGGSPQLGSSLAGAYAFTWASFAARAVGGLLLAWLYAASGSLLLPMIAHFGSNTLEALGMRWGLWPFLATIGLVLAAQYLRASRVPKE